ncbi:MAG: hypothetical protein ACR2MN_13965 [Acidimicrobiales bacterium]
MDPEEELERIRRIPDFIERWRAIGVLQAHAARLSGDLAAIRTEMVREMTANGMSLQQVADRLGISKQRAAQINADRGLEQQ